MKTQIFKVEIGNFSLGSLLKLLNFGVKMKIIVD